MIVYLKMLKKASFSWLQEVKIRRVPLKGNPLPGSAWIQDEAVNLLQKQSSPRKNYALIVKDKGILQKAL